MILNQSANDKTYSVEELKYLLSIPNGYSQRDINKRVINPIRNGLSMVFHGLQIIPVKQHTRGTPIIAYRFTWKSDCYEYIDTLSILNDKRWS